MPLVVVMAMADAALHGGDTEFCMRIMFQYICNLRRS